jgi:hypothetical protein
MTFRGYQKVSRDSASPISRQTGRAIFIALLLLFALPQSVRPAAPVEVAQWRSGLSELDQGWVQHDGDDMGWSRADFDDSAWEEVNLDEIGSSRPGWRWFRHHVKLAPDHQDVRLLLVGGDGTYELYVNGTRVPGPRLGSSLAVKRPVERVFPISDDVEEFEIALRTHVPACYAAWHLPQFITVTMGMPTAIEYERQALESQRLYGVSPSLAVDLLLCLAGITALALHANQRRQREYLFLGLYLFLAACEPEVQRNTLKYQCGIDTGDAFLRCDRITKSNTRFATSLFRRHAGSDVVFGSHLDVGPEFGINFIGHRIPREKF